MISLCHSRLILTLILNNTGDNPEIAAPRSYISNPDTSYTWMAKLRHPITTSPSPLIQHFRGNAIAAPASRPFTSIARTRITYSPADITVLYSCLSCSPYHCTWYSTMAHLASPLARVDYMYTCAPHIYSYTRRYGYTYMHICGTRALSQR